MAHHHTRSLRHPMARVGLLLVLLLVGALSGAARPQAARAQASAPGGPDFNCDGYADLAIGSPNYTVGTVRGAGAVNVIYGTASGLASAGNQLWHQDSPGIADLVEANENFGQALSHGDFNGDGCSDLAVGVPYEDRSGLVDAGVVHIIYGTASGLTSTGSKLYHQDDAMLPGDEGARDSFGYVLASGDFNGDRWDDLAIGVSGDHVGSVDSAGAVNVIYGTASGLSLSGSQLWHEDSSGVAGEAEVDDRFGSVLAAGDFNGDGRDDLAIGVPFEDVGSEVEAGAVNVLYGRATGLSGTGSQIWQQDSSDVGGETEAFDNFGRALAAGDFNGDGKADLAIGVPGEKLGSVLEAGVVTVLYGRATGLSGTGSQIWHQDSSAVVGEAEAGDDFGRALAAGDFNGDGKADLAIGVPFEDVGSEMDAGAVNVLYGTATGLSGTGSQIWHQNSSDVVGGTEADDHFGYQVTSGDFNGNGRADLAIAVPNESVGSVLRAGAVNVLYDRATALSSTGSQIWHHDSSGISGEAHWPAEFGGGRW